MKINDVLECFAENINQNYKFVAVSSYERKMGSLKEATTTIKLIEIGKEPQTIVTAKYAASIPTGQEDAIIEQSQLKALTEFIKYFYDTRNE